MKEENKRVFWCIIVSVLAFFSFLFSRFAAVHAAEYVPEPESGTVTDGTKAETGTVAEPETAETVFDEEGQTEESGMENPKTESPGSETGSSGTESPKTESPETESPSDPLIIILEQTEPAPDYYNSIEEYMENEALSYTPFEYQALHFLRVTAVMAAACAAMLFPVMINIFRKR